VPKSKYEILSAELSQFGFNLKPEALRFLILRRKAPSDSGRAVARWLIQSSWRGANKQPCARCLARIGRQTGWVAKHLGATYQMAHAWRVGVPRARANARARATRLSRERRRANPERAREISRRHNQQNRRALSDSYVRQPLFREGSECAACLFRIGLGCNTIAKTIPIGRTALRRFRPHGVLPAKTRKRRLDLGRDCASCFFKLGFGQKATRAMLPCVSRRRVRRWQKELGIEHAKKNPDRLRLIGKAGAYMTPNQKLADRLRGRIYHALKGVGKKSNNTLVLVGCDIEALWRHLESKFYGGMSRNNYGVFWHVDHIFPCAAFDLTKPEHQRACFNWQNLQPLLVLDNLRKNDSVPEGFSVEKLLAA
jgi:hypothetical protein